jgi:hypothetical protein
MANRIAYGEDTMSKEDLFYKIGCVWAWTFIAACLAIPPVLLFGWLVESPGLAIAVGTQVALGASLTGTKIYIFPS